MSPSSRTKSASLLVLALLSASAAIRAADRKPVALQPIRIDFTVTHDGKATLFKCPANLPESICQGVVRGVSAWTFAPGRRNSVPANIEVAIALRLEATPSGNGYQLMAKSASLDLPTTLAADQQSATAGRVPKPIYPTDELRRGRTGLVTLELWPQPGTDKPRIGRTWFNREAAGKHDRLVDAAAASAVQWALKPMAPEQKSICLTVEFSLGLGRAAPDHNDSTLPCEPTYIEGFAPPKLVTEVANTKL
jgi:hypothetical protein